MTCLVGATTTMICFVGDAAIYKCGVVYIAYNFDFEFVFVDAVVVFVDDDVITVH